MNDQPEVLAFGMHAVRHALGRGGIEGRLLVQKGRKDRRLDEILRLAEAKGLVHQRLPRSELDSRVDGPHQGVILLGRMQRKDQDDLQSYLGTLQAAPFLLVLDGVQDPHNLGACLRSADAAGVHAVIVPRRRAAGIGATVRKVAAGAAEHVPLFAVTNLARTLRELGEAGIRMIGTAGGAETSLYDSDLTGPLALVMGGEEKGLRRLTGEHCDELVSLPMAGTVESLNVSVATGVALFEAVRQRRAR